MNRISSVMKGKIGLLLALLIVLGILSVSLALVQETLALAFLAALISIALIAWVLISGINLRSTQSAHKSVEVLKEEIADISDVVMKNDRNIRRSLKITNDIAGSVGRAAPLIRATNQDAAQLKAITSDIAKQRAIVAQKNQPLQSSLSFPAVEARRTAPNINRTVMIIADEFTASAFASEWHQVQPTPENWRVQLDSHDIELLFIESAWEGNGGAWRYHLVGASAPRPAIVELINECKKRNIPVVFWNKEDPPHFEDFLEIAKLSDYVFTTEGSLIPKYREILGHDRIQVLAFAAQPTMHNPARVGNVVRDRAIAFGGTYFQHKYPERKEQLDYLLPAASKFDLDIFSRLYEGEDKYQFPAPYDTFVRGALPYPQMLGAYHAYKAVINVNSVVDSDTMCARRIFEATACGAAVVTAPSPAIETYFPDDLITTVTDENHAYHKIRTLLRSTEYRDRLVHRAQRHVWENHTYRHRALKVMETLGLEESSDVPEVSVIVSTNRPQSVNYCVQNILRQDYKNIEVIILSHGFDLEREQVVPVEAQGIPVTSVSAPRDWPLGRNLNHLVDLAQGEIIVRMDDDDWYGEKYVRDAVNALEYSGAELTGKAASYIYFERLHATVLTYAAHEHRYTDFVRGATFTAKRDVLEKYRFPEIGRAEDSSVLSALKADGASIYSSDRFNFVVNRWVDKSRHTWTVDDDELFATGHVEFTGNGQEQVSV